MKQVSSKSKIIVAILILIIVIGAAVIGIKGFNFDIRNQTTQEIELYIGKKFEIEDIRPITNEVFGKQPVTIQKVEVYEDQVAITTKEITDEQKSNIVNKINEKYETELKAENISINTLPHTKFRDIIKPYILPLVISTVIILIYIGIRFYKIGLVKSMLKTGGSILLTEIILFALMAIIRFPIGRYTLPLVLFVYLVTLLIQTINLEKKLNATMLEEKD
ncbi:MAG: hypothetical protein IKF17_05530 [Clostridia bacterium]|nr:hypothetical protein [Clostridia bacterium]